MTAVDWIAIAVVLVCAIGGWRRGLIASALSLAGLALGAYAGSRVAPHLLSGGSSSAWTPLAGLIGAFAGAALLQTLGSIAGSFVRGGLKLTPLRLLDSVGGIVFGAATGLVFVWVLGATALLVPGQTTLGLDKTYDPMFQAWLAIGGTPPGIAHAQRASTDREIAFLAEHLGGH